jgi:predicted Rossmann fold flavoprotein
MMAAIRAAEITGSVALLDRNDSVGRKMLLTGNGRCNLTNSAPVDDFVLAFGSNGRFLRNAFGRFFSEDLLSFFQERGVTFRTERHGRVFPDGGSSGTILQALKDGLSHAGVEVMLNSDVRDIIRSDALLINLRDGRQISSMKLLIAAGGASYPQTGSTGDGFRLAGDLGHTIEPVGPGLVPLETREGFVKALMGLTLTSVAARYLVAGKWRKTAVGSMLFTHFGISGPMALDHSETIARQLGAGPVSMQIDMKPDTDRAELDVKLRNEFQRSGASLIKNLISHHIPRRMVEVVLGLSGIPEGTQCHQVTSEQRRTLITLFKSFPLTISGTRPMSEAMVTWGGVSLKEIDPRTMESRKVPGLYFCGEVLDLAATSGGYNLQAAFSTGYVAGESAASSLVDDRCSQESVGE